MGKFWGNLKEVWRGMLEPPWESSMPYVSLFADNEFVWFFGWFAAIVGLVEGAFVSPFVLHWVESWNATARELSWLQGGIACVTAVLAGFLLQFLWWSFAIICFRRIEATNSEFVEIFWVFLFGMGLFGLLFGQSIFVVISLISNHPNQRLAILGFVGGLLIKTFLIPFIKGIVTGTLFRWFMNWLRGGKATKSL